MITKSQVEELLARLSVRLEGELTGATYTGRDNVPNPFRQHPILIGDVLQKLMNSYEVTSERIVKLYDLWIRDIGNKPLQTIASQIEWVIPINKNPIEATPEDPMIMGNPQAKPSPASELFEFLLLLNL